MAQLTPAQRDLFDGKNFATLATINPDGSPQLSVVWCRMAGDEVELSTVVGRKKHRNIERDNRVAILVNPKDAPYSYVEVRGTASMTTEGGRELIDELANKYLQADRYPGDDGTDNVRVVVRVAPSHITSMGL